MSSLQSAMQILKVFGAGHTRIRVPVIVNELGMSRSTARRLVHELVEGGMLRKTGDDEFDVGPRTLALGNIYLEQNPMARVIRQSIRNLNAVTRSTSYAIRHCGGMALTIDIMPGDDPVDQIGYVGERRPLQDSASGRLLLACMPEERAYELLPPQMQASWPATSAMLKKIRKAGLSLLENARTPGYMSASILAKVAGQDEMHVLSICWRMDRTSPDDQRSFIRALRDEVDVLCRNSEGLLLTLTDV